MGLIERDIPDDARAYGIAAARDWPDPASLYRVVVVLSPNGPILVAGAKEHQHQIDAAFGDADLWLYDHTEYENVLARDTDFLDALKAQDGLLILFLGENPKGRTRLLANEADALGIPVAIVQPPPADEPAILPSLAPKIQRTTDVLDRLESQQSSGYPGAAERRRAFLDMGLKHTHDLRQARNDLEAQIDREWAWLDRNPLRLDFCIREHTTLCRVATLTAIERELARLREWVTTNEPERVEEVAA